MITLAFIVLAAFCNAFMDACENENFDESILRNKKRSFWYKRESWKTAPKIFGWKFDAWHVFKSLMVIFLALAIVFYQPVFNFDWYWMVLVIGVIWNLAFYIMYHKILGVK